MRWTGCVPAPGGPRLRLLWDLACWEKVRAGEKRPPSLFGAAPLPEAPPLLAETEADRLRRKFTVLGFLCDRHPMPLYRSGLNGHRTVKAVGPMEFLTFEDETGLVETTFFPEAYHRYCHLIDSGQPYLLMGKVAQDWGLHPECTQGGAIKPSIRVTVCPGDGKALHREVNKGIKFIFPFTGRLSAADEPSHWLPAPPTDRSTKHER